MSVRTGVAVVLALIALAACAEARTVEREGVVAPGRFHETNVVVEVAGPLGWSWRAEPAGAQAYFDVHRHEADGSFTKVREVKSGASHASTVQVGPGLYSYYWEHVDGSPAPTRIAYTMTGQFRFEDEPPGTGRDAPPGDGGKDSPSPAWGALAAAGAALLVRRR